VGLVAQRVKGKWIRGLQNRLDDTVMVVLSFEAQPQKTPRTKLDLNPPHLNGRYSNRDGKRERYGKGVG
jgi:hypothetical protein